MYPSNISRSRSLSAPPNGLRAMPALVYLLTRSQSNVISPRSAAGATITLLPPALEQSAAESAISTAAALRLVLLLPEAEWEARTDEINEIVETQGDSRRLEKTRGDSRRLEEPRGDSRRGDETVVLSFYDF